MDIFFKTGVIQKLCSKNAVAQKKLGPKMARKLQQRMMELKAAETLADISHLPPARCHELKGNRKGQLSVDLEQPHRLLFTPMLHKQHGIERQTQCNIKRLRTVFSVNHELTESDIQKERKIAMLFTRWEGR